MAEKSVRGLSDLQKLLDQLPARVERNIMSGALRAGMRVVQRAAKGNIHSVSGQLARGLKVSTVARRGVVTARLRATGPHAFVAKWVEFGTAAHAITAKVGGWLSIGGIFRRSVQHPGARPRPFMRPALDSQAGAALAAVAQYVKARLTKEGLNAQGVAVEVDE